MKKNTSTIYELNLIPQPLKVSAITGICRMPEAICIILPTDADESENFAANQLVECLRDEWGLSASIGGDKNRAKWSVHFDRDSECPPQGYRLAIGTESVNIAFADAAGMYYAVQTLRQCLSQDAEGTRLPCLQIEDAPALKYRATHYDTKHHQPTPQYVHSLIKELAHYKVNVLVWEWEDKLAYQTNPEIGAPGAFTIEQMQGFTEYARRHHIQLVPLVQGLGHVSFILKHPRFRHLREIADSNWEFCPLKDGSYELLFQLWEEAITATPGVEFLHIGTDETYEVGEGEPCGCKAKADEIGKNGLMQIFIHRCVEFIEKKGRKVLCWGGEWNPGTSHPPPRSMLFVDSQDTDYLLEAKKAGYPGWIYAPNPGLTPLILPYFPTVTHSIWHEGNGRQYADFARVSETISRAAIAKAVEGSITTTWDDSGLHMQCWMPHVICGASFSWNPVDEEIDKWAARFFRNYYGVASRDLRELFVILQDAAEFYDDTFERRVWHYGDIGKITLPDFPRGDLEFSNYWRRRFARLLPLATRQCQLLDRAIKIIDDNLSHPVLRSYDLRVMRTCASLMLHNARLILMLGDMEKELIAAHDKHYQDRPGALQHLRETVSLIENHLNERETVYTNLVAVWEETRLPKGLSLPGHPFVFARDRARHFANRTADLSYLIMDEQKLDLEGYLARLRDYTQAYAQA